MQLYDIEAKQHDIRQFLAVSTAGGINIQLQELSYPNDCI